jgi:hypothetical protein
MVVLPLSRLSSNEDDELSAPRSGPAPESEPMHWIRIAAASTLVASGALLIGGKRRAGLVAAASGTVLAMLDQQDSLKIWWQNLPHYIDEVQHLMSQAESAVEEMATQRDRLGRVLGR